MLENGKEIEEYIKIWKK